MEIISIPLKGALQHEDTTGTKAVIQENDVQIMSAGNGLQHAEKNHSATKETSFLQIWFLPKKECIAPRYDQKSFDPSLRKNQLQVVVSPTATATERINRYARLSSYDLEAGNKTTYAIKQKGNGAYVFVKHLMISNVTGKFDKFDGTLVTENGSINNANMTFESEINSIKTSNPQPDGHVKSDEFFGADQFPRLTFTSRKGNSIAGSIKMPD